MGGQLSGLFTNGKGYIGDESVISVESRTELSDLLKGRNSGGVFLTTIHKFTEDTELLTERNNVISIFDEAHRSQVNLDQKVRITEEGVKKTFGFAKYLHALLPNATYVGFTGTRYWFSSQNLQVLKQAQGLSPLCLRWSISGLPGLSCCLWLSDLAGATIF